MTNPAKLPYKPRQSLPMQQPHASAKSTPVNVTPAGQSATATVSNVPETLQNTYEHTRPSQTLQTHEDSSDDGHEAFLRGEDDDLQFCESSDSDISVDFDLEDDIDKFKRELAEVKVQYNVTNAAMDAFLAVLRKRHPRLPKDSRTLLKPQVHVELQHVAGGQYYHFGLLEEIQHEMRDESDIEDGYELALQINIDGLPLYRSKTNSVYPILGMLQNVPRPSVFVIGIYYGTTKPTPIEQYLKAFLDEYEDMRDGFLVNGRKLKVQIHSVICDAPARAMVKCVKGHGGYSGCDKCIEEGIYKGRVVFPGLTSPLRTDESFRRQADTEHHKDVSPFVRVGLGKIN